MLRESFIWSVKVIIEVAILVLVAGAVKNLIVFFIYQVLGCVSANLIVNCLTWPGVILHETSHAVAGLLTGAKIQHFSVLPSGDTLGHVTFILRGNYIIRGIQQVCTGIAPAVACPLVAYFLLNMKIDSGVLSLVRYYMVACCALHCELSGADVKGAVSGIPAVLFVLWLIKLFLLHNPPKVG